MEPGSRKRGHGSKTSPSHSTQDIPQSADTRHYASMKDDQLFNAIKEKKGWHSYFMALACLLSTRSKDKLWKVGACIVNAGGQVVGQGYNGMLNNAPENTFPWEKSEIKPLEDKTLFVCHAEMNALAFSNLNEFDGCTMYVSTFPCMPCAMRIKAAGISHVYFLDVQSNKGRESEVENAEDILKDLLRKSPIHESVTFDFETLKVSFTADGGAFLPDREPTGGVKKITFRVKDLNDKMVVERMRWEHFFFAICLIEAQKSSEQVKYGACVVTKDNYLVGWGHNRRAGSEPETEVHAEMMAVLRAGPALKNATLYTLQHPCNECAKSMIQRGVAKVIYLEKLLLEEPQVKKRVAEWMFREMEVFTRFYDVTIPSGVKKGKVEVTFEGRKPEAAKKGVNSGK